MRAAPTALACLLAATATGEAADTSPIPLAVSAPPPVTENAKPNPVQNEQHASIPDAAPLQRARDGRPPRGRTCFTETETRDKIIAHHLSDPAAMLRLGHLEGDALSAKLCRWTPSDFVYEIHVLRADGHLVRVYINAKTGESMGGTVSSDRDRDRR